MIWLLAIGLSIWWKSYWVSGFLIIGLIYDMIQIKKQSFPLRWVLIVSILQISWLVVAYMTQQSWVLFGLIIQTIGIDALSSLQTKELKKKIKQVHEQYENQTTLLNTLRQQRHDFHMHLEALSHSSAPQTYIDELHKQYHGLNATLKNEANVVAGVLFTYLQKADSNDIKWTYTINQPLSNIPLLKTELVSLLSNILENALEAAQAYQLETKQQAHVQLTCRKQSGIWLLTCQNHSLPIPNHILNRLYVKKIPSHKGTANHGLGSLQIKKIVNHSDGWLDFFLVDHQFTLKIKIPDIQN